MNRREHRERREKLEIENSRRGLWLRILLILDAMNKIDKIKTEDIQLILLSYLKKTKNNSKR